MKAPDAKTKFATNIPVRRIAPWPTHSFLSVVNLIIVVAMGLHLVSLPSAVRGLSAPSSSSQRPPTIPHPQDRHRYFVTCTPGLTGPLAHEISKVLPHVDVVPPKTTSSSMPASGVSFEGSHLDGLVALYWLRTAHKVLQLVCTNEGGGEDEEIFDSHDLYSYLKSTVDVRQLLGNGKGGMLTLSCKCLPGMSLPEGLRHSHFTARTVKDALVDRCQELHPEGLRPNVDTEDPDVPLVLVLKNSSSGRRNGGVTVSLYRSLASGSLHRRGYRTGDAVHVAALKESTAAGLLYAAGWDALVQDAIDNNNVAVLLDPMMGSGTFLLEAAFLVADVAPGLLRERLLKESLPALRWRDTPHAEWEVIRKDAMTRAVRGRQRLQSERIRLAGNERHPHALELARRGLKKAGLFGNENDSPIVETYQGDCADWGTKLVVPGRTLVVTNPPWGRRLSASGHRNRDHDSDYNKDHFDSNHNDDEFASWHSLATFLKSACGGAEAWVLSGKKDLTRHLRMKKTRSLNLRTADENLRWIQYHIFPEKNEEHDINEPVQERARRPPALTGSKVGTSTISS